MTAAIKPPPGYSAYVAGSGAPNALKAKREYVAQRRAAGLESMSGFSIPKVEQVSDNSIAILLSPMRTIILESMVFGEDVTPKEIAGHVFLHVKTVRSHIKAMRTAVGVETTAELVEAVRSGKVQYRRVGK